MAGILLKRDGAIKIFDLFFLICRSLWMAGSGDPKPKKVSAELRMWHFY